MSYSLIKEFSSMPNKKFLLQKFKMYNYKTISGKISSKSRKTREILKKSVDSCGNLITFDKCEPTNDYNDENFTESQKKIVNQYKSALNKHKSKINENYFDPIKKQEQRFWKYPLSKLIKKKRVTRNKKLYSYSKRNKTNKSMSNRRNSVIPKSNSTSNFIQSVNLSKNQAQTPLLLRLHVRFSGATFY